LPALGLYSVATLVTLVPMNMVFRFLGTFMLAALYNVAHRSDGSYVARVRLAARLAPVAGAFYALGIVTMLNIVMPLAFGRQFTLSLTSVALLALVAFVRMARQEPFTSMLLHEGQTRRLAMTNLASSSALVFEVALIKLFGSFEAVIAGRLLGELVALAVVIYMTRLAFRPALRDFVVAVCVCTVIVMLIVGLGYVTPIGTQLAPSIVALAACGVVLAIWASRYAPPMLRAAGFSQLKPLTAAGPTPDPEAEP